MILDALTDVGGLELSSRFAAVKKGDLATSAERVFGGTYITEVEVREKAQAWVPEVMRALQAFMLGTTGFLGWPAVALLTGVLAACLAITTAFSRALDALALGEGRALALAAEEARRLFVASIIYLPVVLAALAVDRLLAA